MPTDVTGERGELLDQVLGLVPGWSGKGQPQRPGFAPEPRLDGIRRDEDPWRYGKPLLKALPAGNEELDGVTDVQYPGEREQLVGGELFTPAVLQVGDRRSCTARPTGSA